MSIDSSFFWQIIQLKVFLNGEVNIGNNNLFQQGGLLMAKKKGNNYIIDEENGIAKIELNRWNGKENLWAIIDLEDLDRVINFP